MLPRPSPLASLCLALAVSLLAGVAHATAAMPSTLTAPNVPLATEYYSYFDATLQTNVATFEVYAHTQQSNIGLETANAGSAGGEVGLNNQEFFYQWGQIYRYCVEMVLPPGKTVADLQSGGDDVFGPYACCAAGISTGCDGCDHPPAGRGKNTNPKMVGRSFNLGLPAGVTPSEKYGWWYSFDARGHCGHSQSLNHSGCTWRASPYVTGVSLPALQSFPEFTMNPANLSSFQTVTNMMINAFDTPLMTSFFFNATRYSSQYTPLPAQFRADPQQQCRVKCAAGTFSSTGFLNTFSSQSHCTPCKQGTYQDQQGMTACKACPAQTTTLRGGATSADQCFSWAAAACAPGSFNAISGHAPCTLCPAGTYQSKSAALQCEACPIFTTSLEIGASVASTCQLDAPRAVMIYAADGILENRVGADVEGAVNMLQSIEFDSNPGTWNDILVQCIETVDTAFYEGPFPCFNDWCAFPDDVLNLPVYGASQQLSSPTGNNGHWNKFRVSGHCTDAQKVGEDGCTWKAASVVYSKNLGALINETGFYSCEVAQESNICYNPTKMTTAQWDASTAAFRNYQKIFELKSLLATPKAPAPVIGPISIKDGRCHVQCPAGYKFRSAFTLPYCVPTTTTGSTGTVSSFLAADEESSVAASSSSSDIGFASESNGGAAVGFGVAAVAIVCVAAAVIGHRVSRRERGMVLMQ